MAKNYSKKCKFKYVMLALACTATFSFTGLAAACSNETSDNTNTDKTTSTEDTQLIKNGNFEYFNVPDEAVHLIKTPLNWTSGGTSSYTKSGIIGTSETAWAALTDEELADKLDYNNDLDSSDSAYASLYVDYNGMKSSDILYKDTYAALNDEDNENAKDLIENPGTHYNVTKNDAGELIASGDGNKQIYEDENGDYFLDEDFTQPISNVLMLHNYSSSTHYGINQNYSSVSVELPANTAAEVSVWVKTSNLLYDKGVEVDQNYGANITVTHTIGSSTLDDFSITSINTEKLIAEGKADADYNGWVQYTVYVKACDFASTTLTIKLGLGETDYPVEGYAFFDDVEITKFIELEDADCSYGENADKIGDAYCTLSSDASEKIFKADSYSRNGGEVSDERFSNNFYYLLDLASESEYRPVTFENAVAGLTIDDDNYVSSDAYNGKLLGFNTSVGLDGTRLPKNFASLNTEKDFLAYVKAGYSFTAAHTNYYDRLNSALESAANLPGVDSSTNYNVLVMLSAYGAAYTSSFDITMEADSYRIISLWVKTSDMSGNTAATLSLTEQNNDDNVASVTIDTTGITTDVDDDNKDIYDGWVQCFFFVENDTSEDKVITFEFNFGISTIKDTTVNSYKAGWAAIANMHALSVDEDTFAYTGSGTYTASLTISEDEESKTSVFDEAYGSQANEIKNGIVNPSTYTGVNGGSSSVVNNGSISLPFDDINTNTNAGLINKEYFENYTDLDWYGTLLESFNVSSTDALTAWNEIFGTTSIQPLIIINSLRDDYLEIKGATADNYKNYWILNENGVYEKVDADAEFDEDTTYYSLAQVMNYGFIGSEKTLSASSYSTVSVKVKVSKGAVAYIYLVDTSAEKNILTFTTPSYSFYYDEDGNVLKSKPDTDATLTQQRENVLYSLRDDGLYEDADGALYANIWNYTKSYRDETVEYYDANGKLINFEDIVDGEIYYKADGTEADYFLVTTDGVKVYEYKDGSYYYIVEGKAADKVEPFDINYARYNYTELSEEYMVKIDGTDPDVADKWITVNFVIHTGSESKSYRLELWSGSRDSRGVDENGDPIEVAEGSAVIFDYSYYTVSDDTLLSWYETEIIRAYQELLNAKGLLTDISTASENIDYYKALVDKYITDGKISQSDLETYELLNNYTAYYYTYSLYDSANFQPFNKDTADEDATGYDYSVNDYSETLAYLSVKENDNYLIFADYSTVDQSISIDTATDDTTDTDTTTSDGTSVWLLVSSIVLVVALLFTLISIYVRDLLKKMRRNKTIGKNNYNQQKRNRYIRKLHITKQEFEEVDPNDGNNEEQSTETEDNDDVADENVTEDTQSDDNNE